jgi:CRP/FNR family cyclic AMP-dependent transcriptional regulator
MNGSTPGDLERLAAGRPRPLVGDGETLLDKGPGREWVRLLLEGSVTLCAETPFGPHPVGDLPAPVLFGLSGAIGGAEGICRAVVRGGGPTVVLTFDEARRLLFAPDGDGPAFRRVALGSLTAALRATIGSLAGFFDPPAGAAADAEEPAATPPLEERPVDLEHAGALFDAAGLDPAILPSLGLVARTLMPGATLFPAGSVGEESAIVAEGRLRVSVTIPGAGEEALAILGPGEIVGEMSLVDDAPRSASVFAHNGPATVYVLSRDVFRRLVDSGDAKGTPLLAGIAIVLARRLEEALRKAAGFRILSGPI